MRKISKNIIALIEGEYNLTVKKIELVYMLQISGSNQDHKAKEKYVLLACNRCVVQKSKQSEALEAELLDDLSNSSLMINSARK